LFPQPAELTDGFKDRDAILLHLDNLICSFLKNQCSPLIRTSFVEYEGREILRIDCQTAPRPVFLKPPTGNDVEFFIRRQASSVKLRTDDALAYIQQHFHLLPQVQAQEHDRRHLLSPDPGAQTPGT
jgi:hypothetical protein